VSVTNGREGPVVTLDGPAGSGKSTTAREVARRLGFRHLDSGSFYRALTYGLLEAGIGPERWDALGRADLDAIGVRVESTPERLQVCLGARRLGDEIRTPEVTSLVSRLASLGPVREWLLGIQRDAGKQGRLVADGRDMGTVVFPAAEVKIFLVADLIERARRRLKEQGRVAPSDADLADEAARIRERDRDDSERKLSPLRRPDDALELDTTRLSFEEQVDKILTRVREVDSSVGPR
jgi:cytidylate kinase